MRDDQRNYAVVGVFVIAVIAALVAWIAVLAGRTGPTDSYHVHFANVMGLSNGTQVLYEGYPIGRIEDLRPTTREGRQVFRLDVSVEPGWRIPEDSTATITASGLLAAVVVNVRGGKSTTPLEPGDEIPSVEAPDLFGAVSSVAADVGDLIEGGLKPVLDALAEGGPAVTEDLEALAEKLNETLVRIDGFLSGENARRIEHILANLDSASSGFAAVSGGLEETRLQIDELLDSVNALVEENRRPVGQAVVDMHESLESVSRHIEAIAHHLEVTTRNMNEFSRQIRENPGVIVRGRALDGEAD
jgi:phospholipid/cholesterol/gamma-HCH transport system substrate-binding protein